MARFVEVGGHFINLDAIALVWHVGRVRAGEQDVAIVVRMMGLGEVVDLQFTGNDAQKLIRAIDDYTADSRRGI